MILKIIENKRSFVFEFIFLKVVIVDYKYLLIFFFGVIVNIFFDVFFYVIEGYFFKVFDYIIEVYVKKVLSLFESLKDNLKENVLKEVDFEKFVWILLIGGIIII